MRPRSLVTVPVAILLAFALIALSPDLAGAVTTADFKSKVIAKVNKKREANGCRPLRARAPLGVAAQGHSDLMAAQLTLSHQLPGEPALPERVSATGYPWTLIGENVAYGFPTPKSVVKAWMNSPGHRANILNCSFKHTGVGLASGGGVLWWTQVFGRK
jgi:uncharacterized protein YkwD